MIRLFPFLETPNIAAICVSAEKPQSQKQDTKWIWVNHYFCSRQIRKWENNKKKITSSSWVAFAWEIHKDFSWVKGHHVQKSVTWPAEMCHLWSQRNCELTAKSRCSSCLCQRFHCLGWFVCQGSEVCLYSYTNSSLLWWLQICSAAYELTPRHFHGSPFKGDFAKAIHSEFTFLIGFAHFFLPCEAWLSSRSLFFGPKYKLL